MEQAEDTDDDVDPTGAFLIAIFDDVRRAERELQKDDSPFTRRAFVRTTFASVEGFAFTMKKVALSKPELFAPGELAILREEEYHLTSAGEMRVRRRFLRTAENLRFAFGAFMKFHGAKAAFPEDDGWRFFVAAIEVRNLPVFTALDLGGTLSGEHGIGIAKARYMAWEQSAEVIDWQKRLKRLWDPKDLLNPGKIFL